MSNSSSDLEKRIEALEAIINQSGGNLYHNPFITEEGDDKHHYLRVPFPADKSFQQKARQTIREIGNLNGFQKFRIDPPSLKPLEEIPAIKLVNLPKKTFKIEINDNVSPSKFNLPALLRTQEILFHSLLREQKQKIENDLCQIEKERKQKIQKLHKKQLDNISNKAQGHQNFFVWIVRGIRNLLTFN